VTTFCYFEGVGWVMIICMGRLSYLSRNVIFDNIDMEGIPIEWRHVSGFRTHRSVKWCLNSLKHNFHSSDICSTVDIPTTVHSYAAVIKNRSIKYEQILI
jgi:hypothetical protein